MVNESSLYKFKDITITPWCNYSECDDEFVDGQVIYGSLTDMNQFHKRWPESIYQVCCSMDHLYKSNNMDIKKEKFAESDIVKIVFCSEAEELGSL